jgi:prepilin-type N-terminal cleavage/methylation domain-containing protein
MKNMTGNRRAHGFTLLELLVAMAIFTVISGSALVLFAKHQPIFNQQQNMGALNIQIRNAVSQLQLDTINAGSGYYQGINIPDFPVGLTIENHTTTPCNTPSTFTYGPNCFDILNIVAVDSSAPPSHPTDIGTNCVSSTSATLFANPIAPTTAAQLAGDFHNGDQLLLVSSDGSQMTSVILTKDGSVSGSKVQLQHNPTGADGTNSSDPAFIAVNPNNKLGTTFCSADWILKISPITYKVDTTTDPSNPKLIREQPSGSTNDVVVAEQLIGFKVGAITWNSCTPACTSDDGSTYNYDSSTYVSGGVAQPYNFSLIRSVQLEVIARTNPNPDPSYVYRNGFDGGPYQIQSVSVVVNPRNLTMSNH